MQELKEAKYATHKLKVFNKLDYYSIQAVYLKDETFGARYIFRLWRNVVGSL